MERLTKLKLIYYRLICILIHIYMYNKYTKERIYNVILLNNEINLII